MIKVKLKKSIRKRSNIFFKKNIFMVKIKKFKKNHLLLNKSKTSKKYNKRIFLYNLNFLKKFF